MALKVTVGEGLIAKRIEQALRDARDCPDWEKVRMDFHHYVADDESDEVKEFDVVASVDMPELAKDIPLVAHRTARKIVDTEFEDNSVQGYESVTTSITATDFTGEEFDITEQIIGDGDGYEWEIQYVSE